MLHNHSYKAEVEDNVLTWTEGMPPELKGSGKHEVLVTVPENTEAQLERSKKLAEVLRQLAKLDPFKDINDPSEWQREIRKDRPQPGRD